ncbi:MAG: hypothetical protein H7A37_08165 [Chlamydiales bacterium]|nr:hypothetical protein [Chlamydiales bacterium]
MSEEFDNLVKAFDKALQKKEKGSFGKSEVKEIYSAASTLFDGTIQLDQQQIEQIRDKWVKLAEGRIDKGNAMKKLQGTSRAEAIQSVLLSIV